MTAQALDTVDRDIVNTLQGGFPLCERPYAAAAAVLGIEEADLIDRLQRLLADGYLSRFGPMYDAERLGGAVTLAAMDVPEDRFDDVADMVNAHDEVAHNYERGHALNMWFVIASDRPDRIPEVVREIEKETGLRVYDMPKQTEFFIGLRFEI